MSVIFANAPVVSLDPTTAGVRTEWYDIELLDSSDNVVGEVVDFSGLRVERNANADVRNSGSFVYEGAPLDWKKYRIKPHINLKAGGQTVRWSLGVFIPETGERDIDGVSEVRQIDFYGKTQLLEWNQTHNSYSVLKGKRITDEVRERLNHNGYPYHAITDGSKLLATTMTWEPGTSLKKIINELLKSANYFAIWDDIDGVLRVEPYIEPADRNVRAIFKDDADGLFDPRVNHEADWFNVPNKVVVIGQSTGDTRPPRAYATITTGEAARQNRGDVVMTRTEQGDFETQAECQARANQIIAEAQRIPNTYTINHLPVELEVHDLVQFQYEGADIDALATVQSITYTQGELVQTVLRGV